MTPTEIFLDPKDHAWLAQPAMGVLYRAIEAGGGELRVVGGAVRDALLGRPVEDVDMAVNLPPEQVMALLAKVGVKTVPTGLKFGTITAVFDHKGYEITTLRHDLEPDGRWAKVEFTDDWQADAARRDFTINALYLDKDHCVHDFFDGRTDLQTRIIRFIGDPHERIAEDHLRILRAFRFMAQIEGAQIEQKSLLACFEMAHLLPKLSVERVWKELSRLLAAKDPAPAFQLMVDGGVTLSVLPEANRVDRLNKLIGLEPADLKPCPLRRLSALLEGGAASVSHRLKLSKAQSHKLLRLETAFAAGPASGSAFEVRQKLYDFGAEVVRDVLYLLVADGADAALLCHLELVHAWTKPVFPLQGRDLKALGLREGATLGRALADAEIWWRLQDFVPDKTACLAYVRAQI